ncbi:MAG TPA: hypothetical protein VHV30_15435 [Polyangiaceae bacterium]|jgi:hypothetical protein|nr:hypothetical protein [Polyangiaceae bacterium]
MTNNSKEMTITTERQMLVGIDKYLKAATTTVTIAGTPYTPAQLESGIQAHLDAAAASQTAKASYAVTVQKEQAARALVHEVILGLKAWVVAQYGKNAVDVFTDFGFAPPKTGHPSPETKVAAAAKAKATREARGTRGKKQRLAITGATPAPAPAAPAPSTTAPAAPAAAATPPK